MNTRNTKKSAMLLAVCLTAVLCVGSLSGCVYQEIDQDDIANAVDACKDKGGVFAIEEDFTADTVVT